MLVALMFPAFTQLSTVDWLELEKNALTCQEHDTDAPRFGAPRYCSSPARALGPV